MAISYQSAGGGRVTIPQVMAPWMELGLASSGAMQLGQGEGQLNLGKPSDAIRTAQKAFREKSCGETSREKRARLSVAYEMVGEALFSTEPPSRRRYPPDEACGGANQTYKKDDPFVLVAAGATEAVMRHVKKNPDFLKAKDVKGNTLMYKAARSGFYDLVQALINAGSPPNEVQSTGSTALHAACFFGHRPVAELLLEHGASFGIKNTFGNTPLDEAISKELQKVLQDSQQDEITKMCQEGVTRGIIKSVVDVRHNGNVVAIRAKVAERQTSGFSDVWHGTKLRNVLSICANGLQPTGATLGDGTKLTPHKNHYELGKKYCGVENWAAAVFLSPSIAYAGHVCYAERVFSRKTVHCVIVGAQVRDGAYKAYPSTVLKHEPLPGEPQDPEYRVEVDDGVEDQIWRVDQEKKTNIRITDVMFITVKLLESGTFSHEQMQKLLLSA